VKINIDAIFEARSEVEFFHRRKEERQIHIVPMVDNSRVGLIETPGSAVQRVHSFPRVTVKYDENNTLVLHVPETPELEELREKLAEVQIMFEKPLSIDRKLSHLITSKREDKLDEWAMDDLAREAKSIEYKLAVKDSELCILKNELAAIAKVK
jgi:hypothetical protein